jgi:hypothetical protein
MCLEHVLPEMGHRQVISTCIKMYCTVRYWHVNGISLVHQTGLYWRVIRFYVQQNVLQTVREYPVSSVCSCKSRCLQRCSTAAFTRGHSTSSRRVVGNREVIPSTRQCAAVCGVFSRFVSTANSCLVACAMFSRFVTFRLFLIPTTDISTDSPSLCWQSDHSYSLNKTTLRHSGKCFPGLLRRPPATL